MLSSNPSSSLRTSRSFLATFAVKGTFLLPAELSNSRH